MQKAKIEMQMDALKFLHERIVILGGVDSVIKQIKRGFLRGLRIADSMAAEP